MAHTTGLREGLSPPPPPPSFVTALLQFVHRLRGAGVPVSMVEALDAADSIRHIDLAERSQLRGALAATLVKRAEHLPAFESLFDIYFAVHRDQRDLAVATTLDRVQDKGDEEVRVPGAGEAGPEQEAEPSADRLSMLLDALRTDDQGAMRALAALAVDLFGGINAERTASARYYLYRILRQLELSELLRQALM